MGFPPEAVPFGISIQDTKVGSSGVKVSNLGTLGAFGRRGVLMPRSRAFNAAALLRPVFGTPLPSKVPSKSEIAVMSKVEEERPIGTTVPSTPEICRPFLGARLRSGAWLWSKSWEQFVSQSETICKQSCQILIYVNFGMAWMSQTAASDFNGEFGGGRLAGTTYMHIWNLAAPRWGLLKLLWALLIAHDVLTSMMIHPTGTSPPHILTCPTPPPHLYSLNRYTTCPTADWTAACCCCSCSYRWGAQTRLCRPVNFYIFLSTAPPFQRHFRYIHINTSMISEDATI